MKILTKCDKCGNDVLYNDSEDIAVIACPICGKRFYVPDSMIKGIEKNVLSQSFLKRLEVQYGRRKR